MDAKLEQLKAKFMGNDGPVHHRIMPLSKDDYFTQMSDARKLLQAATEQPDAPGCRAILYLLIPAILLWALIFVSVCNLLTPISSY